MSLALLLPLGLSLFQQPIEDAGLAEVYGERWTTEARVYQQVGSSVVSVDVYEKLISSSLTSPTDFLGKLGKPISQGAGVVVDSRGFVITNAHVVQPEGRLSADDLLITLTFMDGPQDKEVVARVHSIDAEWDLALLKIYEKGPYTAITMADPERLLIGEKVIAIGTAYGNTHSLTSGILSGVQRNVEISSKSEQTQQQFRGMLQTDAAINPGNSGGPLLNVLGELIGINSATLDYADGIGYAIPVGRVEEILKNRLLQPNVWLGISLAARGNNLTVNAIHPRGPAARAGLELGDRLIAVNSVTVLNPGEFGNELVLMQPGEIISIDYEREDRRQVANLTLQSGIQRDAFGVLGFLCDPNPSIIMINDAYGYPTRYPVLKLTGVFENTGAARLGLKAQDSIIAVHLLNQGEGDGWVPVSSQKKFLNLIHGPDFDFLGQNIWWMTAEGKSKKGRLSFDDPDLVTRIASG